uniref:Uncharacterized protein n=1 Tax=Knipowitschia caucasica TaxID=637954 RepID=A0AAV2KJI3_KNICA
MPEETPSAGGGVGPKTLPKHEKDIPFELNNLSPEINGNLDESEKLVERGVARASQSAKPFLVKTMENLDKQLQTNPSNFTEFSSSKSSLESGDSAEEGSTRLSSSPSVYDGIMYSGDEAGAERMGVPRVSLDSVNVRWSEDGEDERSEVSRRSVAQSVCCCFQVLTMSSGRKQAHLFM